MTLIFFILQRASATVSVDNLLAHKSHCSEPCNYWFLHSLCFMDHTQQSSKISQNHQGTQCLAASTSNSKIFNHPTLRFFWCFSSFTCDFVITKDGDVHEAQSLYLSLLILHSSYVTNNIQVSETYDPHPHPTKDKKKTKKTKPKTT